MSLRGIDPQNIAFNNLLKDCAHAGCRQGCQKSGQSGFERGLNRTD
jgi:hypothetical protein